MMFWYGHGVNCWGWFAMSVGTVLFWALIITLGVLLFRALARPGPPDGGHGTWRQTPPDGGPEQILAERYARGEIDDEEYHRRLTTLRRPPTDAARP
ncbi:SHOCT domain-containing protein [Streptomyces sp. NPDC047085]|uniref:SHOCT domain-containing protein n=1 Tax=Streptomyces sp. NPDC047085 TaxID=3155140 RepID=UPI0033CC356C